MKGEERTCRVFAALLCLVLVAGCATQGGPRQEPGQTRAENMDCGELRHERKRLGYDYRRPNTKAQRGLYSRLNRAVQREIAKRCPAPVVTASPADSDARTH